MRTTAVSLVGENAKTDDGAAASQSSERRKPCRPGFISSEDIFSQQSQNKDRLRYTKGDSSSLQTYTAKNKGALKRRQSGRRQIPGPVRQNEDRKEAANFQVNIKEYLPYKSYGKNWLFK